MAAPIGPVNSAQIERGIRFGFFHSWLLGVGATLADGVFMVLVYFGVIHFLNEPFMKTFLWLFGAFVLTYSGIESLIQARRPNERLRGGQESPGRSLVTGFLLSISNPMSILFWLGIYGSALADMTARYDAREVLVYSMAILAGIMFWDVLMALVAGTFRRLLTSRLFAAISVVSGLSLIGFGLFFGFEALRLLFG